MKTKPLLITILLTLASLTLSLRAAEPAPPPVVENAPTAFRGFYTDQFLLLATKDFSHDETFGYGLGVGYAFTKVFAADVRLEHEGLNITGQAVRTIGGRAIARLPFEFLSPYSFVGAAFDLGPDQWKLRPGIGIEFGVSKRLQGLSIFAEGGLDADLKGSSAFLFSSGIRWRF